MVRCTQTQLLIGHHEYTAPTGLAAVGILPAWRVWESRHVRHVEVCRHCSCNGVPINTLATAHAAGNLVRGCIASTLPMLKAVQNAQRQIALCCNSAQTSQNCVAASGRACSDRFSSSSSFAPYCCDQLDMPGCTYVNSSSAVTCSVSDLAPATLPDCESL